MDRITTNSRHIRATAEEVYNAFINPAALEVWQAPGNMTAKVHQFDLRIGGGYQTSLFYPDNEKRLKGKTTDNEDKHTARFVELVPNKKIVEAIQFETTNPDFESEMIKETPLEPVATGTSVTILFENIPVGTKPEDNEAGTISPLEKLAKYVEGKGTLTDKQGT